MCMLASSKAFSKNEKNNQNIEQDQEDEVEDDKFNHLLQSDDPAVTFSPEIQVNDSEKEESGLKDEQE